MINDEEESLGWLTHERSTLLPNSKETHKTNKYRPICCIPTTYKWLTGIITEAILWTPRKWRASRRRTKMLHKEQSTMLEDFKGTQRNLSMAWIDYKKAFDNVTHSWIKRYMELYKCTM